MSLHNLYYYLSLMSGMRSAIEKSGLESHIEALYEGWGQAPPAT